MIKKFDDLVEQTETGKKSAVRALQFWQYLIGKAYNRQIVIYDELKQLTNLPDCRPLNHPLKYIMNYCSSNGLPPLTLLVVNKDTGIPGEGFSATELSNYHREREKVFNFQWFSMVPPSIEKFAELKVEDK